MIKYQAIGDLALADLLEHKPMRAHQLGLEHDLAVTASSDGSLPDPAPRFVVNLDVPPGHLPGASAKGALSGPVDS
jgi:hypothetical protein